VSLAKLHLKQLNAQIVLKKQQTELTAANNCCVVLLYKEIVDTEMTTVLHTIQSDSGSSMLV